MAFTLPVIGSICRGESLDAAGDPTFAPHFVVDTRSAGGKLFHENQL